MERFRVGDFVVEPQLNRIRRVPYTAHIESKAMEVLCYLAEHPKEVLPKERIIRAVWPDTFVTDDVLTHAISELRKAFQDDARDPRFIQTIPRKGYRLIAPVSREETAPARRPRLTVPGWYAAAAAALVVAFVLYGFYPRSTVIDTGPILFEPIPLTTYPGRELEPSFSPDGNRIAFTWDGENGDNTDIYVKGIGPGPPLRLTDHPAVDFGPAWSPKDDYIAFLRKREPKPGAAVVLLPPLGGAERTLTETLFAQRPPDQFHPPYLAWTLDGQELIFIDKEDPDEPFALFLLSPRTGAKRRLTRPPVGSVGDGSPAFSPDGRTLAFSRLYSRDTGNLYLMALDEEMKLLGEPRRLTSGEGFSTSPSWDPEGRGLVFSAGTTAHSLWWIDAAGATEPRRLTPPGISSQNPVVSRPTRRLVFSNSVEIIDIWKIGLAAPGVSEGEPVRLISSTLEDFLPEYSPDGKRITFTSTRSGHHEVWVCASDGSNPLQLTSFSGPRTGTSRWSPDGQRIAFDSRAGGNPNIYVIGKEGGRPQPLTTEPSNDGVPSWSRDGRWIYFASNRVEGGGVFKVSPQGGEAVQVTDHPGLSVTESSDGKSLYYFHFSGQVWKHSLEPGGAREMLLDSVAYDSFEVVNEGVYFVPRTDEAGNLTFLDVSVGAVGSVMFLDFATRETRLVLQMEGPPSIGLSVSSDGRSLLYSQKGHVGADLMLVEDFR